MKDDATLIPLNDDSLRGRCHYGSTDPPFSQTTSLSVADSHATFPSVSGRRGEKPNQHSRSRSLRRNLFLVSSLISITTLLVTAELTMKLEANSPLYSHFLLTLEHDYNDKNDGGKRNVERNVNDTYTNEMRTNGVKRNNDDRKRRCYAPIKDNVKNIPCTDGYVQTAVVVDALNGRWPQGLTWTLLQDLEFSTDRTPLYTMSNTSLPSSLHLSKECSSFLSHLCLKGDYILYVMESDWDRDHSFATSTIPSLHYHNNALGVHLCDKYVQIGEAEQISSSKCIRNNREMSTATSMTSSRDNYSHKISLSGVAISSSFPTSLSTHNDIHDGPISKAIADVDGSDDTGDDDDDDDIDIGDGDDDDDDNDDDKEVANNGGITINNISTKSNPYEFAPSPQPTTSPSVPPSTIPTLFPSTASTLTPSAVSTTFPSTMNTLKPSLIPTSSATEMVKYTGRMNNKSSPASQNASDATVEADDGNSRDEVATDSQACPRTCHLKHRSVIWGACIVMIC